MTPANCVTLLVTLTAATTDLLKGRVYNKLTYSAAFTGLVMSAWLKGPSLMESFLGLAGGFLLFFVLYKLSGLGAGDVKLMAAIGALKGLPFVMYSAFYILCIGVAVGLLLLAWRGRLASSLRWVLMTLVSCVISSIDRGNLEQGPTMMPFAPVIFRGVAYCIYLEISRGPLVLQWWN
jgi:prepilin peptidase CpaA